MTEAVINTIEQDIAELEKRLHEKKEALEQEKSSGNGAGAADVHPSEKEMLHEAVGEKIQEHIPEYIAPLPTTEAPSANVTESPSYLSQELKDKVKAIVDVVFTKNLFEGIKAVENQNPAVIKAFHDILTDELYEKMIVTGKLEKVE